MRNYQRSDVKRTFSLFLVLQKILYFVGTLPCLLISIHANRTYLFVYLFWRTIFWSLRGSIIRLNSLFNWLYLFVYVYILPTNYNHHSNLLYITLSIVSMVILRKFEMEFHDADRYFSPTPFSSSNTEAIFILYIKWCQFYRNV